MALKGIKSHINILLKFTNVCSGVMWPYEGMHPYMRAVVPYVPVQPAVEAYRAIAMRGWTMAYPAVYMGYASTVVWTAVFILLTIALTRSHKDSL